MWRSLRQTVASLILVELCFTLVAHTLPLFDAGPHVRSRWGEPIRIRHLYTARKHGHESLYLRIHNDGRVDGDRHQSSHSLLEIRAVAVGSVVFKAYHNSLYLCMEADGKLYGMSKYSPEDCSFEEEILPDGYNMYKSHKYGIAVSLSKDKQRQQYRGKGFLPLSHFLPLISLEPMEPLLDDEDNENDKNIPLIESMDLPGIMDSLSYHI
ncbi:fibroblast growth factor 19 [Discoglossus pictus]